MIRLLDKSKISFFNYFYIFCMFIYAGSATVFARGIGDVGTLGNAIALMLTILFYIANRIKLTKPYHLSIAVFMLYAVITTINNWMISPRWIFEWIIWLTIAYGICQGFRERLFVVVETVLYHLSIISLICWFIHLTRPGLMTSIVTTLEFSRPYEEDGNVFANMIIYTINNIGEGTGYEFSLFLRNAGFAWEPGAFACFVCLGIYCNILRTGFRFRNRSLLVFLLALLTTQSTTGFIILLVMILLWLVINGKYLYLLLLLPVIVMVFNLPFVRFKLFEEINNLQYHDIMEESGSEGRLFSFQLSLQEFLRHPIIGLGGYAQGTWLARQGYDIAIISGIGNLLVYYGTVMTILFIVLIKKACKYIRTVTNSRNSWLLYVVILGMMISFNLWKQPIYIALWMYGVYASGNKKPRRANVSA